MYNKKIILYSLSCLVLTGCDNTATKQSNSGAVTATTATSHNLHSAKNYATVPLRKIIFVTPAAFNGDLVTAVKQLANKGTPTGIPNICSNLIPATESANSLSIESGYLAADCLCSSNNVQSQSESHGKLGRIVYAVPSNYASDGATNGVPNNYVYRAVLQGRPLPATESATIYYPVESAMNCVGVTCYPVGVSNTPIATANSSGALVGFSENALTTRIFTESSALLAWTGITPTNTYIGNVVQESPSISNFWYNMNLTIQCYVAAILSGLGQAQTPANWQPVNNAVNQVMFACATPESNFQTAYPWSSSARSINAPGSVAIQTFGIYGATFSKHGSSPNYPDPQIDWGFVTPPANTGGCARPRHLYCAGPYPAVQ